MTLATRLRTAADQLTAHTAASLALTVHDADALHKIMQAAADALDADGIAAHRDLPAASPNGGPL